MASAVLLAAVLLLASPAAMAAAGGASSSSNTTGVSCGSEKFPAGQSYANCTALAPLGAALYWTYDAAAATLSVAFVVATPAGGAGWVAWAVNPTGDGMAGAQALLALRGPGGASAPYAVRTYNLTGYGPLPAKSTPIEFKPTGLAADESAGKVRLYGKLQLKPGTEVVNHIWQVGSAVSNGSPAKHAFAKENLDAKGKLALVGGAAATAPAPKASASSSANKAGGGSPPPSGGKSAATATYASALLLAVLALAGFLAIV